MNEILLVSGNPSHRRRKHKARRRRGARAHRRHHRSARSHRKSYRVRRVRARRNPVALSVGGVLGNVKAGAIGAVGGIANDIAFGYIKGYLPAMAQSGIGASVAKLLSAVGVGWLGDKAMRGKGRDFAVGAATVVLHELGKSQLASMVPSLPLGEYMFDNPSNPSLLGYNPGQIVEGADVGEYIVGDVEADEVGEYNDDAF